MVQHKLEAKNNKTVRIVQLTHFSRKCFLKNCVMFGCVQNWIGKKRDKFLSYTRCSQNRWKHSKPWNLCIVRIHSTFANFTVFRVSDWHKNTIHSTGTYFCCATECTYINPQMVQLHFGCDTLRWRKKPTERSKYARNYVYVLLTVSAKPNWVAMDSHSRHFFISLDMLYMRESR